MKLVIKDEAGQVIGFVYHIDAVKLINMLEDNLVDMFLTDIPYGTASKSKVQKLGGVLVPFDIAWDISMPVDWIPALYPKLKEGANGVVWIDNIKVESTWKLLIDSGFKPLQTYHWHKTNPVPHSRKNFCSSVETAIFFRKPGKVLFWDAFVEHNFWEGPIVGGFERRIYEDERHPTQKPVKLFKKLIEIMSPPAGIILDPYVGSGTTCEAATELGRRFIAGDNDLFSVGMTFERLTGTDFENRSKIAV